MIHFEGLGRKLMESKETCKWKFIDTAYQYTKYYVQCGSFNFLLEHTFKQNNYKFCPYCAREIEEVKQ